ncbi:TPA: hypothetical protein RUZ86_003233 [Klebsiella pneumoniae]|nr:hypothetical protein [Klebsiella pneumoniae]HDZ9558556.1 hypothetical protein [Klebsiella pneumoniae]
MTNHTEMERREKFEAWAEEVGAKPCGYLKKQRNPSGGYSVQIYTYMWTAWKAAGAELVEAFEKAQQQITHLEYRAVTVKLPKRHSMLLREDFNEDYHTEMAFKADEVQASLSAAGIKVEAE